MFPPLRSLGSMPIMGDNMTEIYLGAYATEQEALEALSQRSEPSNELSVMQDGDTEHPWRIKWVRPD